MTTEKHEEIKLFDGTKFLVWKSHMQLYLEEKDLWNIVTRDDLAPIAAIPQPEKDAWNKKNFIAKRMISSSVTILVLENLVNCFTTKCMWTSLCSLYQQQSKENIYML